jgi:hypothetical protein
MGWHYTREESLATPADRGPISGADTHAQSASVDTRLGQVELPDSLFYRLHRRAKAGRFLRP